MIIEVYLGISILAFILCMLKACSLTKRMENEGEKGKGDTAGAVLVVIKLIVFCFLPILNVFIIYAILFCGNEIGTKNKNGGDGD